ncbi:DUF397 domain-containing protein [Nocardia sp. NBC_01499]|uniref:DUF397 domain-containing protein n=1 Tax=Nocardia sp. NBC_01499 TaxID=2903597 RepID=UPI003865FCC7
MISRDRLTWRTSSRSGTNGGQCVEIAFDAEARLVLMRDSKFRRIPQDFRVDEPVIEIPEADWSAFLAAVTSTTVRTPRQTPAIVPRSSGEVAVRGADGTTLTFTAEEWSAFVEGVLDGEFAAA